MALSDELSKRLQRLIAEDPIGALTEVATVKTTLAELERKAVLAALGGHSWRAIGDALGVSKQAVFQRFGKEWAVSSKARMSKQEWRQEVKRRLSD